MDIDVPFNQIDNSLEMDNLCHKFSKLSIRSVGCLLCIVIVIFLTLLLLFFKSTKKWVTPIHKKKSGSWPISLPKVTSEIASEELLRMWCLSCEISMNYFVSMVNKIHSKFTMLQPIQFIDPSSYLSYSVVNSDDIQIFLIYPDKNTYIGHYICTYYNATAKIVYIFDSCVKNYSNEKKCDLTLDIQYDFFNTLYPEHLDVKWKIPKSTQKDQVSCGVFSISYALLLLEGKDPEYYEIPFLAPFHTELSNETIFLRKLISNMFQKNELSFTTRYVF